MVKIIIGSGWWCDREVHRWSIGSKLSREAAFFDIWYKQVNSCFNPQKIIVIDSNSPIKPNWQQYNNIIQWVNLDKNYGHAADIACGKIVTKYSGFTRSVLMGAMYALCNDADWYVYVEQDCLVFGDNLLEKATHDVESDIILGKPTIDGIGLGGGRAAEMLQQSLMFVKRSGIERFISGIITAPWTDGELSPEEIMRKQFNPIGTMNIGFGRSRPVDFSQKHFYIQHLTDDEYRQAMTLIKKGKI